MNTLDSAAIRYRNAKHLRDSVGGVTNFGNKIERSQAQASSIIGDNPTKGIGSKMARHIEESFNLPSGWLDVPHHELWDGNNEEPKSPREETHVIIPRYNVTASCGNGILNDHVELNGGLAFMRSWLRDQGWTAAHLVVIYARKDSMAPPLQTAPCCWWIKAKPTYSVLLSTAAGEAQALSSKDGAYISQVINSLSGAIVHRG